MWTYLWFKCVNILMIQIYVSAWLLLHVQSDFQGTWVPSFDWVPFVDVYVVLVCEHSYGLRICARVVVATRLCFSSCYRLRYRVVSEWCFRIHIILCPRECCYTMFWFMF